jgi:6-pyruvoyl-tetrahydropterin synthase
MTQLINWRNPDGNESNLANWRRDRFTLWEETKMFLAEGGFILLTLTATVESVFYTTVAITSYFIFSRWSDLPFQYSVKLLKSSCCTVIWGAINVVAGIFLPNLPTTEYFCRYPLDFIYQAFFQDTLLDEEDEAYRQSLIIFIDSILNNDQPNFANFLFPNSPPIQARNEEVIKEGAALIKTMVVNEIDILEDFFVFSPRIYVYIVSKIAFLYVQGEKKDDPIPEFFKDLSKTSIKSLRKILETADFSTLPSEFEKSPFSNPHNDQASALAAHWDATEANKDLMRQIWDELKEDPSQKNNMVQTTKNALESLVHFKRKNAADSSLFKAILEIANRELTGGLLTNDCWKIAFEDLEKEYPS